ncbi:MAG: GNAT family N-acetyltransferase, partial [Planctomycetota bacterium]
KWVNRLDGQTILLARQFDRVLGFISVTESGYIDLAFVRPQSQRKGILRSLYEELENITVRSGLVRLSVHASLMAEPAFTRMGFMIVGEETVEVGGQTLSRFEMAKDIV